MLGISCDVEEMSIIQTAVPVPPETEEHFNIRKQLELKEKPGFILSLIDIIYRREVKFGLTIRNYDKHVMVSKLEPLSLCAAHLLVKYQYILS